MSLPNIFYAQSGGVTSVINASAAGVIEAANKSDQIGKVYAGANGILGALQEDLIDTSKESKSNIQKLMQTPGGAFGSCRYKLKSIEENQREYKRLIDVFAAHNIRYFLYNGGGDSADTCRKVAQISKKMKFPMQAIHIPKTIDNDLPVTDNSPGFGSVAKYIATSTREACFDLASMYPTSTKVFVYEVMGRHAGWIAAAGALAADDKTDLPIIVLLPEVPFNEKTFLEKVQQKVSQYGYASVVVSEGLMNNKGELLAHSGMTDAFGHAKLGGVAPMIANLIEQSLGLKNHWAVADYLQRSARHIASATDVKQAYELGRAAIKMALQGKNNIMLTLERQSSKPYRYKIGETALSRVANKEKKMPKSFISKDGYSITDKCREYMLPLMAGEDYPTFKKGLPDYVILKNVRVAKKLDEQFNL